MRMKLHYLAMMIIIPIYAIQVCPFIEKIDPIDVFATIGAVMLLVFFSRATLISTFVEPIATANQSNRLFVLELSVLALAGLLFATYNVIVHDFPFASGLKVLVGILAMGLFASTDAMLVHERKIVNNVKKGLQTITISENFTPFSSKLALYAVAYLLLIVAVFSLLIIKDLNWIATIGEEMPLTDAKTAILKEFGFVLFITLFETIIIILSFSRNINLFLSNENTVLKKVAAGDYDIQVPIGSNDEFGSMALHTNNMIRQILDRTNELNCTRDVAILTLASLAETRDNETGAHILRTQRYVKALACHLRTQPKYASELDDESIDLLYKSAPLHDIGKVGIPDAILLKPGKHTDEEFEIMKKHAEIGADALKVAEEQLGSNSFLRLARVISLTHHEKWNGSGYPRGLQGEDIPLSGRLMAVADVYDALITKRVYKPAFSHQKAMTIIREGSGQHFDPAIVDALDAIENQFIQIAEEFSDASYIEKVA